MIHDEALILGAPPHATRLGRALDLAQLFNLPAHHPDRMIAASVVLYVGLGIIIAITVRSHFNAAHP